MSIRTVLPDYPTPLTRCASNPKCNSDRLMAATATSVPEESNQPNALNVSNPNQIHELVEPIAEQPESSQNETLAIQSIPKKRGGKRIGAGRKPNIERALQHPIKPVTAALVLSEANEFRLWQQLLHHPDARIRLDALKYCTDRRDGKAKQAIEHLGPDGGPLQAAVLVKFVESEK